MWRASRVLVRRASQAFHTSSTRAAGGGAGGAAGGGALVRDRQGYTHFNTSGQPGWAGERLWLLAGGGAVAAGGVYYATHLERVPITGRSHFVAVTEAWERRLGAQAHAAILQQYRGRVLPPGHSVSRLVTKVGKRLVATLDALPSRDRPKHLQGAAWEFTVVDSPEVNAFVLPGGKVVVFTGLLRILANESELGTILGHEIAHVVARHPAEKVSQRWVLNLGQLLLMAVVGPGVIPELASMVGMLGLELPFSRKCESEADSMGLALMSRACFDPRVAPGVFAKLGRVGGGQPPKYLNTHPPHKEREQKLRAEVPAAWNLYMDSGCEGTRQAFGRTVFGV